MTDTRIVTSTYRYKRPPRKRKAVAAGGAGDRAAGEARQRQPATDADRHLIANDGTASRRSSPRSGGRGRFGDVPDMTPEEHQRRGDAADALFREIERRATANDRPAGPARHWRSYGTDPLPTGAEALDEPFRRFPSWFLRITCDRCGKDRMVNEAMRRRRDRAAPRHPRAHAPRRLRRTGGQGGAAHRHRGRQQPAGAADRAGRRMT